MANTTYSGRADLFCPECREHLRFTLKGNTLEHVHEYYRRTYPQTAQLPIVGYLRVIENVFGYSCLLPLTPGENTIGRYNPPYIQSTLPVHTDDPSMDRYHTLVRIEEDASAQVTDCDSMTGTFLNGEEIHYGHMAPFVHGDTLTLGATSLIFIPAE